MNAHAQLQSDDAAFRRILGDQLARYPLMQVQDLYKLIHQAAMGSEHAVRDVASAQAWLDREVRELGEGPAEPALDPISGDGQIVRVHLRPYIQMQGDLDLLLRAFVRTANEYRGEVARLRAYAASAGQMADAGLMPFAGAQWAEFCATLGREGYPAMHHSTVYEAAYHPAYRVVAREFVCW